MKVTAIIPDDLIRSVQNYSQAKNITESLKIALNEWVSQQKVKELIKNITIKPLNLKHSTFVKIRTLNRKL